jgi:DNA (cytosine-5)-methyltransferase 1/DNA (cytosine-5)-methyltransferase 3A
MNVLSLFNGMSFCAMALETLGIHVNKYYSSEIDKYANQATQALYPNTIQLGDVTKWREWDIDWASIDLVTGGFPCQTWSMAGKQLGDKDDRGMLFWVMLDIMKHIRALNPGAQFLIENVKMKKEFEEYITAHTENALGKVYKVLINSALVSAQNRKRYYWTSFEVGQPEDKGIMLKDIIEQEGDFTYMSSKFIARQKGRKCLRDDFNGKAVNLSAMEYLKNGRQGDYIRCGALIFDINRYSPNCQKQIKKNSKTINQKAVALCVNSNVTGSGVTAIDLEDGAKYRKLTPRECMRLQTVPSDKIETLLNSWLSNSQLYKMNGNGWTHDVIVHIFKNLPARNVNLELF